LMPISFNINASVFTLNQIRRSFTAGRHCTSPNPRKITSTASTTNNNICANSTMRTDCVSTVQKPLFGIVAALTTNRVIGVNGSLPWKHTAIPQDRDHFVNLTHNKILIIGRKSFAEEDPTGAHVNHVRVCIVVSRTMSASDLVDRNVSIGKGGNYSGPEVKLARSFDEALDLASREIAASHFEMQSGNAAVDNDTGDTCRSKNVKNGTIECWVAGGELIYQEALQHNKADEVHLTHVDMTVDLDQCQTTKSAIALFPVDVLERNGFEEVSRVISGICTFCLYKRQPAQS